MTQQNASTGALQDIRVIEYCDEKGHYVGKLLAGLGAKVLKVEPPGGDAARTVGPFVDDIPHQDRSLYFWHYNAGKRGVTLDIESEEGKKLFLDLIRGADVFIESSMPGYLDSLGLGYSHLSALNPRLVMTSITPFGQTGPYAHYLATDLVSLAMGGPMASCGYDDVPGSPPIRGNGNQGYQTAGHWALVGTLMALLYRDLTGEGQYVDSSIHEACSCTTEGALPTWIYNQAIVKRQTGRHASQFDSPPSQYLCKDGVYINLLGALPRSQGSWNLLREWMDREGMVGDLWEEKYNDFSVLRGTPPTPEGRHAVDLIGQFVVTHTSEEIYQGGQEIGNAWGVVRAPEENLDDPHWWDRGFFVEVEHPELGKSFTYPGAPFRMEGTPFTVSRRAPLLGEHNVEVYGGELGLSYKQLGSLGEKRVI